MPVQLLQFAWPCGREQYPDAIIEVGHLDLACPDSVRAFAEVFNAHGTRPLHVLVNNAGANYLSDGATAAGVPDLVQVGASGIPALARPNLAAGLHAAPDPCPAARRSTTWGPTCSPACWSLTWRPAPRRG